MNEFKNLSERIIGYGEKLYVDDVREFLKKLKEKLTIQWDTNCNIRDIEEDSLVPEDINEIIDELAGEKLIIPRTEDGDSDSPNEPIPSRGESGSEGVNSSQDGVKVAQVPHEHQVGKFDSSSCDGDKCECGIIRCYHYKGNCPKQDGYPFKKFRLKTEGFCLSDKIANLNVVGDKGVDYSFIYSKDVRECFRLLKEDINFYTKGNIRISLLTCLKQRAGEKLIIPSSEVQIASGESNEDEGVNSPQKDKEWCAKCFEEVKDCECKSSSKDVCCEHNISKDLMCAECLAKKDVCKNCGEIGDKHIDNIVGIKCCPKEVGDDCANCGESSVKHDGFGFCNNIGMSRYVKKEKKLR